MEYMIQRIKYARVHKLNKNAFLHFMIKGISSLILLITMCTGCSKAKYPVVFEEERSVELNSFYDASVREAIYEDMFSRINAIYLDLETGSMNETSNSDIFYLVSCGNSACGPIVQSVDGVLLSIVDTKEPTLENCSILLSESRPGIQKFVQDYPGIYTCIQTVEGNVGWIRVDKSFLKDDLPEFKIQITYWLWNE
jgi:hypothetical protein